MFLFLRFFRGEGERDQTNCEQTYTYPTFQKVTGGRERGKIPRESESIVRLRKGESEREREGLRTPNNWAMVATEKERMCVCEGDRHKGCESTCVWECEREDEKGEREMQRLSRSLVIYFSQRRHKIRFFISSRQCRGPKTTFPATLNISFNKSKFNGKKRN